MCAAALAGIDEASAGCLLVTLGWLVVVVVVVALSHLLCLTHKLDADDANLSPSTT